jgi:CheY-like chemotaxis protein
MGNLLINAIKYTETGGAISIRSSKIKGHAQIEIHDTGIGIAPGFLGQLFQPFRRGTKEWLTSDVGLGLGLAIARSIIEMHGGTIWAESPGLGRGSTFYVRMVLAPAEAPSPDRTVGASGEPAPVSSLCVLLIDDHKDVADLTKMELEELGYGVLTASDGHQGLEIAIREIPDVIISDIKMPRMDGYELIHSLRRIPGLAAVPVVALTGFGMKKDVEAAVAAGYDAHLNKPVDVNVLSELIQRLAAHRRHSNRKSD